MKNLIGLSACVALLLAGVYWFTGITPLQVLSALVEMGEVFVAGF